METMISNGFGYNCDRVNLFNDSVTVLWLLVRDKVLLNIGFDA